MLTEVVDCVITLPSLSISTTERLLGTNLLGLGADFVGTDRFFVSATENFRFVGSDFELGPLSRVPSSVPSSSSTTGTRSYKTYIDHSRMWNLLHRIAGRPLFSSQNVTAHWLVDWEVFFACSPNFFNRKLFVLIGHELPCINSWIFLGFTGDLSA